MQKPSKSEIVDARWADITWSINSLGCGSPFAWER